LERSDENGASRGRRENAGVDSPPRLRCGAVPPVVDHFTLRGRDQRSASDGRRADPVRRDSPDSRNGKEQGCRRDFVRGARGPQVVISPHDAGRWRRLDAGSIEPAARPGHRRTLLPHSGPPAGSRAPSSDSRDQLRRTGQSPCLITSPRMSRAVHADRSHLARQAQRSRAASGHEP
jgi:hypothetical protein